MNFLSVLSLNLLASILLSTTALAADADITLVIHNHQFQPAQLQIPAGKKVRLTIENRDATPEEFESYELNREKVIGGNSKGSVFIGPLKAGSYPFFGDFNQKTAQGVIVVK